MGRKKNPNKKTTEEIVRESLQKEHEEFKNAFFEAPTVQIDDKEQFRAFWAMNRKAYKKPKELEDVIWAHLKAAGFDKPELFEQGIQHFGLKK